MGRYIGTSRTYKSFICIMERHQVGRRRLVAWMMKQNVCSHAGNVILDDIWVSAYQLQLLLMQYVVCKVNSSLHSYFTMRPVVLTRGNLFSDLSQKCCQRGDPMVTPSLCVRILLLNWNCTLYAHVGEYFYVLANVPNMLRDLIDSFYEWQIRKA